LTRRRATVSRASRFDGVVQVPGDKSLAHRSVLFTLALGGETVVEGLPDGADVGRSIAAARSLGAGIEIEGNSARIRAPAEGPVAASVDCGNSGTTARLLLGILSSWPGADVVLSGDASLSRRPMRRVTEPLRVMGASIALGAGGHLPASVSGQVLAGRRHVSEVASAQVKTALLLAGARSEGETWVREPVPSRDHTERWLPEFGVDVLRGPEGVGVRGASRVAGFRRLVVPGDPSSAAFFAVAAAIVPGGVVRIEGVSLNPTRLGAFDVLRECGARVEIVERTEDAEPFGTIEVRAGVLTPFSIGADRVPSLVDELPVLSIVAAMASGTSRVRGASELRVKESDRLSAIVRGLRAMGVDVDEHPDGFDVHGGRTPRGARIDAGMDHRIAMSFAVAALVSDGETAIDGADWVDTSFPGFWRLLAACSGVDVRVESTGD